MYGFKSRQAHGRITQVLGVIKMVASWKYLGGAYKEISISWKSAEFGLNRGYEVCC